MDGGTLRCAKKQRVLGVYVEQSLKMAAQVDKVVKNGRFGFVSWDVDYKNTKV